MSVSPTMLHIITLMHDGWELGNNVSFQGRPRIQQGGLGKGGEALRVHRSTFYALLGRKLIEPTSSHRWPMTRYKLTERGEGVVKTAKLKGMKRYPFP
jgi:hypothetical protein